MSRLTEYYLFVSLGGVLGGAFAALAAPAIFNNVYEYPLALAAACLFRPRGDVAFPRLSDAIVAAAAAMVAVALMLIRLVPADAVLVVGALGGAAAVFGAGWSDDGRAFGLRYGMLIVGALCGVLAIVIALNGDVMLAQSVIDGASRIQIRSPWDVLLMAASFLLFALTLHSLLQPRPERGGQLGDVAYGIGAIGALLLLGFSLMGAFERDARTLAMVGIVTCALGFIFNRNRPYLLCALVLAGFAIFFLDDARGGRIITQHRDFFGVLRTRVLGEPGGELPQLRVLLHGTTLHGAQIAAPGFSRLPLTYYNPRTALGEAILAGLSTGDSSSLALIGLGTGSTACLMRPDDRLTIYEINPAVVDLSMRPGGDFTFVAECAPDARLELGDARLRIQGAPDDAYDVIVVDAFSSDAIPAHLLTREAIALYLRKTSERGIVVLHLSNRNLALVSEAARVARDVGAPTLYRISTRFEEEEVGFYGGSAASVMILARRPETLARLPLPSGEWRVLQAPPGRGWSDDYINLARALWENLSGKEECRIYPHLSRCARTSDEAAPPSP